ncbi:MAG: hypothetical protein WBA93_22985 [Microcoleaceae cyanobacterium]
MFAPHSGRNYPYYMSQVIHICSAFGKKLPLLHESGNSYLLRIREEITPTYYIRINTEFYSQ